MRIHCKSSTCGKDDTSTEGRFSSHLRTNLMSWLLEKTICYPSYTIISICQHHAMACHQIFLTHRYENHLDTQYQHNFALSICIEDILASRNPATPPDTCSPSWLESLLQITTASSIPSPMISRFHITRCLLIDTFASAGFAPETGVMPMLKSSPAAILNQLFNQCLNPKGLSHRVCPQNKWICSWPSHLSWTSLIPAPDI